LVPATAALAGATVAWGTVLGTAVASGAVAAGAVVGDAESGGVVVGLGAAAYPQARMTSRINTKEKDTITLDFHSQ
jgi:hypothetical protein